MSFAHVAPEQPAVICIRAGVGGADASALLCCVLRCWEPLAGGITKCIGELSVALGVTYELRVFEIAKQTLEEGKAANV